MDEFAELEKELLETENSSDAMDEFAELEKELLETENSSDASLQDVLNLLKNGKLEVDYTIFLEDKTYTPAIKCGLLALGVILIAMILPMAPGVATIWFTFKLGPLWSTTRHITCINYLGFCHSILEYEYKNEQLVEAKLTKLNNKSYVSHGWKDFGDNGGQNLAFYIYCSGNYKVELGECIGLREHIRKEIFQEVYQKVKDVCRISGLKNNSKVGNKKYAKWIKEMS
jgi:hypothetical protein